MNFNEKLINLRKEKGLSQEALGEKLNVARQTVSKWELGETTPEMDKLVRMSELFEISLDELMKDTDMNSNTTVLNYNNTNTQKLAGILIKAIKIIGIFILVCILATVISAILFSVRTDTKEHKLDTDVQIVETQDGKLSQMKKVVSDQVREIVPNMSYADVVNLLGETLDSGSGVYILNYIVDNNNVLAITFYSMSQPANLIGEELLNNLIPINEYI